MPELDLANARFARQQILNMERPEAVTGKHFVMDDFMQGRGMSWTINFSKRLASWPLTKTRVKNLQPAPRHVQVCQQDLRGQRILRAQGRVRFVLGAANAEHARTRLLPAAAGCSNILSRGLKSRIDKKYHATSKTTCYSHCHKSLRQTRPGRLVHERNLSPVKANAAPEKMGPAAL